MADDHLYKSHNSAEDFENEEYDDIEDQEHNRMASMFGPIEEVDKDHETTQRHTQEQPSNEMEREK